MVLYGQGSAGQAICLRDHVKFVAVLGLRVCLPGSGLPAAGAGAVRSIFGALAFEENRSQFDGRVKFVFRARGYSAFFLRDRVAIDRPARPQ
jgi:hypothetical protein